MPRRFGYDLGGSTMRKRPTFGWDALTATEFDVVALVAQGRSLTPSTTTLTCRRRTRTTPGYPMMVIRIS
jgi:hypothetical protein